jgi:TetR/AcrR family transcriptional repressor of nem operon
MRYPEGHKEAMRARIVEAASRALRRDGLDAVSIPALMKSVGLTHGGFYVHFRDRDELVAEAVAFAANETVERIFAGDDRLLDASLAAYLSEAHATHPAFGCVLAALGTEAHRQPAPVRRSFAEAAGVLLRQVQKKLHPRSKRAEPSDDALALASRMVGAVVLARLVRDEALATRILAVAARDSAPAKRVAGGGAPD